MFNIVLSSTGSHVLVYFYSDAAVEADGFEIDYWLVCFRIIITSNFADIKSIIIIRESGRVSYSMHLMLSCRAVDM